jgi:ABC-type multidrug transport system fused ATPase/permease subunit
MPFLTAKLPMIGTIRQLIDLFTPSQRRTAASMIVLMIGGMVLETLGIGLVIPAVMLLTRTDLAVKYPGLFAAFHRLGIDGPQHLIIAGMLVLVVAYGFKTLYIAWLTSRQMAFVYRVQAELSERLFVDYIHKPYTFHLQRNSSELIRNVVTATNELTLTGLVAVLILATECLVLAGISALLLVVEPLGTLIAASFLAAVGYFMNGATRRGIRSAATERQNHEAMRIRYLQQALGGVKELKLLGREQGPLRQYTPHNDASARIGRRQATLKELPKLWLELLAVSGLAILVFAIVWQGKPLNSLIPTIGMFAAAAFRLIPSLNRILGSLHYLRQSTPIIATLHTELDQASPVVLPSASDPLVLKNEITAVAIEVRYPGAANSALVGVNFRVPKGTTAGFIGESGAGKSTLVDALLGLLPLENGSILADGANIHASLGAWQASIGYVPQAIYLVDDTIRRNIAFGLPDEEIDERSIRRAVAEAQLVAFVADLPEGLDTVVGERGVRLSGGQRQRIGIARALYHNPSILVLDEATSSLDSDTEAGVMQAVDALHGEKTILIVTHRSNTLRHCDKVFRVENRSVIEVVRPTVGT